MTLRARDRLKLTASKRDWYRIVNKADDEAAVYIYDEIGGWGVTAEAFVNELNDVKANRIDLHLNSPGGEVWDGLAIHNAIQRHKAHVTVYVDGLAASAASFIAMAGDRVVMGRGSQMMIHDALGITIGNAADHREMAELLDRHSDSIAGFYAEKAGGTVEQWRNRMRDETWYFGPEAVKAGLADEALGADSASSAMARVANAIPDRSSDWDLSIYRYAGRDKAPVPPTDTAAKPTDPPAPTGAPTPGVQAETELSEGSTVIPSGQVINADVLAAALQQLFATGGGLPSAAKATPGITSPAAGTEAHLDDAPDDDSVDDKLPAAQPVDEYNMADVFRQAFKEALT